jgi:hypothetical protein
MTRNSFLGGMLAGSTLLAGLVATALLTGASSPGPSGTDPLATVLTFGAKGDGQADDTKAIQRAVDAKTGDVRFPRGVYRITRPIVVELDRTGYTALVGHGTARIVMAGPGPAIRLIGTHEGTASPHTVKSNVWENQRMPMVEGLEIRGAHDEACGIEAAGTMELTVSRVHVHHTRHAIHLVRRNRNVIISDCHLYENRGVGVYLDDVNLHQINVAGCHISYNAAGGIVSRGGNVRNLHVTGCDIEGNMSPETPPTANVLIDCSGGAAGTAEVSIVGCTIQHTYLGPDSANVRFAGADAQRRRWGHVTIGHNVFSDAQINVDIDKARGVTLCGNTFWQGYRYNLRVVDSSSVVIGSNNLDRNPNYVWSKSEEASDAVLLKDCRDVNITGLYVNGARHAPAGVQIERCQRINLTGCSILDCENIGLLLTNVEACQISACRIQNDVDTASDFQPVVARGENEELIVHGQRLE